MFSIFRRIRKKNCFKIGQSGIYFDIVINKNSFLMTLSFEKEAINQWTFQLYLKYLEK